MRKQFRWAMLATLSIVFCSLSAHTAFAITTNVVVSQVQAGASSSEVSITTELAATKEYISIYNNGESDVDVTNWCITNKSNIKFVCFTPTDSSETFVLPSHTYLTICSGSFCLQNDYTADFMYSSTSNIVASGDTISLLDSSNVIVDSISWSTTNLPPGGLPGGSALERKFLLGSTVQLADTNTIDDFAKKDMLIVHPRGLEEVITIIDLCLNIDGAQSDIPDDYIIDSQGDCIQQPDLCVNLAGLQAELPIGYIISEDNECVRDLLNLEITELFPNAIGSDDGNEFIEIYNPNDTDVDLAFYRLSVGTDSSKSYTFPSNAVVGAHQYIVFSDHDINFTLVNSSSKVAVYSDDGYLINESTAYDMADDGMAWALIDDVWQYTNRPTPGTDNLSSLVDDTEGEVLGEKICAPNQYLNPDTNRCKLIVTLTPCKDGQYRSEITNRCRSIASDANIVQLCAEGEERNLATNRCRQVASTDTTLAPWKEGQERNPDTNRCRNIVAPIPDVGFAVEPIVDKTGGSDNLWIYISVGVVALGYAVWEWRYEFTQLFRKVWKFLHFGK